MASIGTTATTQASTSAGVPHLVQYFGHYVDGVPLLIAEIPRVRRLLRSGAEKGKMPERLGDAELDAIEARAAAAPPGLHVGRDTVRLMRGISHRMGQVAEPAAELIVHARDDELHPLGWVTDALDSCARCGDHRLALRSCPRA
jgi:hypothetical protein